MSDKKSCENCKDKDAVCSGIRVGCPLWQRNQSMWLSILPTEPGWYFYSHNLKKIGQKEIWSFEILQAEAEYDDLRFWDVAMGEYTKVKSMRGMWQGPITPKG